jgi:hypothetical protein
LHSTGVAVRGAQIPCVIDSSTRCRCSSACRSVRAVRESLCGVFPTQTRHFSLVFWLLPQRGGQAGLSVRCKVFCAMFGISYPFLSSFRLTTNILAVLTDTGGSNRRRMLLLREVSLPGSVPVVARALPKKTRCSHT